jgi:serine/threonine protein kinase
MQSFQNLSELNLKKLSKKLVKELLEYRIEGTIGEGNYGKVKYGTHILTSQPVAIKYINKNRLIKPGDMERIKNEMKIITSSNHPNILKAYEIFEDESYFYIVMERPERGDLFNYICSKGRLSLDEASFIYYQLVNAVSYLQKMKIAHRDLKPENILLTEDFIVKIGDFGLSKYYNNKNVRMSTICGSPCYSAPEMLRGNRYKPYPIDVWGIGIILYCMVCGALPFEDIKEDDLIRKVIQCDYNCPYYVNQNVRALFKRIFCSNPNERITMEEIKMNSVYNMGKANFMKYFKIFNEEGELLPQVQRFIKEKTIKYLETECSMEIINRNIEQDTAYKIFFHTFMHKTKWEIYHIPKNNMEEVEKIKKDEIEEKAKDKVTNLINIIKEDENAALSLKKENKKNQDILFIPPHKSLCSVINKTFEINNEIKLNLSKKDIEAMTKLGILTHSFDTNWIPQINYQEEDVNNNENEYKKEGYKKPKKNASLGSMGTTVAGSQKMFYNDNFE